MRKTLICGNCGQVVDSRLSKCPRCGTPTTEGEPTKANRAEGTRPAAGDEPGDAGAYPPFENFIEEPFEKMDFIVRTRFGERLDKLEKRLIILEKELDSFLFDR